MGHFNITHGRRSVNPNKNIDQPWITLALDQVNALLTLERLGGFLACGPPGRCSLMAVGQPFLAVSSSLFHPSGVAGHGVLLFARLDYNVGRIAMEGLCVPIEWKFPGMAGNRTG